MTLTRHVLLLLLSLTVLVWLITNTQNEVLIQHLLISMPALCMFCYLQITLVTLIRPPKKQRIFEVIPQPNNHGTLNIALFVATLNFNVFVLSLTYMLVYSEHPWQLFMPLLPMVIISLVLMIMVYWLARKQILSNNTINRVERPCYRFDEDGTHNFVTAPGMQAARN